uniref:Uncharacterized protein n=1 Tax=Setaria viridis TaxID=4556 RepID=A0A4U6SZG9_SETVI|nr:hypothetical protein SEVIR_9G235750v2 [Setaria viridis]
MVTLAGTAFFLGGINQLPLSTLSFHLCCEFMQAKILSLMTWGQRLQWRRAQRHFARI